jgi:hypothetical protein
MTTETVESQEPTEQTFSFDNPETIEVDDPVEPAETTETPEAAVTNPTPMFGAETPAPDLTGAPVSPPPESITTEEAMRLRAQNQELHAQQQAVQQAEAQRQFNDEMSHQGQQLIEQGFSEEQAAGFTQAMRKPYEQMRAMRQQLHRAEVSVRDTERGANAKMESIFKLSKQYGVEPSSLQNFNDPTSMEQAAKQAATIKQLNDKVTALEQGKVPAGQQFDSGRSVGMSSSAAERAALRKQDAPWSDAQFAKMKAHLGM